MYQNKTKFCLPNSTFYYADHAFGFYWMFDRINGAGLWFENHWIKLQKIRFICVRRKVDNHNSNLFIYWTCILQHFLRTNFIFQANKSIYSHEWIKMYIVQLPYYLMESIKNHKRQWAIDWVLMIHTMSRLRLSNEWLNLDQRGKIKGITEWNMYA